MEGERIPLIGGSNPHQSCEDKQGFKWRFLVSFIIILSLFSRIYEKHVLSAATIKLVSYDVIASELTDLRESVIATEILGKSATRDAALKGSCPLLVEVKVANSSQSNRQAQAPKRTIPIRIGARIVEQEVDEILDDVEQRLDQGKLVDWTTKQRANILMAQPLGQLLGVLPLSRLGLLIGNRSVVFISLAAGALHNLLAPSYLVAAPIWLILALELMFGALSEGTMSVFNPVLSNWLPAKEFQIALLILQLSLDAGLSVSIFVTTLLLANNVPWYWTMYLPGIVMTIIAIVWLLVSSERPSDNNKISSKERLFLENTSVSAIARRTEIDKLREIMKTDKDAHKCNCRPEYESSCPALRLVRQPVWSRYFSDPSIWAQIAASFTYYWKVELWALTPTFLLNVVHVDPKSISAISSSKAIMALVFGIFFYIYLKRLAGRRPFNLDLLNYRRVNYFLGTVVSVTSNALLIFFECSLPVAIFSIMLNVALHGFNSLSYLVLPVDKSPEDSGITSSLVKLLSPGAIISLPVFSLILSGSKSVSELGDRRSWSYVFLVAIVLDVLACIIFIAFANVDKKSFSKVKQKGECQTKKVSKLQEQLYLN